MLRCNSRGKEDMSVGVASVNGDLRLMVFWLVFSGEIIWLQQHFILCDVFKLQTIISQSYTDGLHFFAKRNALDHTRFCVDG